MAGVGLVPSAVALDDEVLSGLRRLMLRRLRQLAPELCATACTYRSRPEEFLRVFASREDQPRGHSRPIVCVANVISAAVANGNPHPLD